MNKLPFICCALLIYSCSNPVRDNPFDRGGTNPFPAWDNYVVIDNFDVNSVYDNQLFNTLSTTLSQLDPGYAQGVWYSFSDKNSSTIQGTTTMYANNNPAYEMLYTGNFIHSLTDGMFGKCVRFSMHFDTKIDYPYAGIGCILAKDRFNNLSSLEYVSFWAKGTGTLILEFINKAALDIGAQWESINSPEIVLTNEWLLFSIPAKHFTFPDWTTCYKQGYTWDTVKYGINKLQIRSSFTTDGSQPFDVWIDDIKLVGVTLNTFIND